jgi:hypothetical protein
MVIMLFFQVGVMILERYVSRTNTRITKRRGPKKPTADLEDKYRVSMTTQPSSMTI